MTTTNNFDLENMRQQMAILKNKLDQQQIISDRLLRQSMKKNVSSITRRYYMLIAVAVLMVPYSRWAFVTLAGLSMPFWYATSIFMIISAAATYYNSRNLSDSRLMHRNLLEARTQMARAKKFDSDWLLIGIPCVILWLGWYLYEAWQKGTAGNFYALAISAAVGGTLGAIIGLRLHFKTQREYQEIIDQIEELSSEE